MTQTYDVFLSYSHDDAAWVGQLADKLAEAGLSVWFDEWVQQANETLIRLDAKFYFEPHFGAVPGPVFQSRQDRG